MKYSMIASVLSAVVMAVACSNENTFTGSPLGDELDSEKSVMVTFSRALTDKVSVLIFGHNDTGFKYQKTVYIPEQGEGNTTELLEVGDYKFLFMKYPGINTRLYPEPMDSYADFEDIRIEAKEDPQNEGHLLPVDEIWLPETAAKADTIYKIDNPAVVRSKLKRAVSRVQLNIYRGFRQDGEMIPYPFPEGRNIMEHIQEIRLDIGGVGEILTIQGGAGSSSTRYRSELPDTIKPGGYAVFNGPFVFPNGSGENSSVGIRLVPREESPYPVMTTAVQGLLERNKKLEITLWLTAGYQLIDIHIRETAISEEKEGDSGIWE